MVATYDWSVHKGVCIAPHPKCCAQKQGKSTGSTGANGAEEKGMTKEFKKRWAGYDNKNPLAWVYDNDQTDKDQGKCWWQHIGSYHQVQGADLDVIGVIIGPSIIFDEGSVGNVGVMALPVWHEEAVLDPELLPLSYADSIPSASSRLASIALRAVSLSSASLSGVGGRDGLLSFESSAILSSEK